MTAFSGQFEHWVYCIKFQQVLAHLFFMHSMYPGRELTEIVLKVCTGSVVSHSREQKIAGLNQGVMKCTLKSS
jgi:hypothetical protein